MITNLIIILLLIILSGIFKGFHDALLFHYGTSIFAKFKNKKFWNPSLSSNNKYNRVLLDEGIQYPKFCGSTTFLVWLTDGQHLLQMIWLNLLFIAFGLTFATDFILIYNKVVTIILVTIVFALLFKTIFEITYSLSYKENYYGK